MRLVLQTDRAMARAAVREFLTREVRTGRDGVMDDPELFAARLAWGITDGSVILNADHPLVMACIGAGDQAAIFIPVGAAEVSFLSDTTNEVAAEFRLLLGQ